MAPRPTEIRAVSALLLEEHPDAETLARAVIETLDALRADRPFYVAAVGAGVVTWGYGAYSTPRQAEKALHGVAQEGLRTGVVRVYPSGALSEPEILDPASIQGCSGCGHPAASHGWPRSSIRGCVVGELTRNGRIVRPACDCGGLT